MRVVKAQEQVVAGTLHHLTLEAIDAGKKKLYEAKVWVKPWMDFKELQEFKHAGDASPSFTSSDLGVKQGDFFVFTPFSSLSLSLSEFWDKVFVLDFFFNEDKSMLWF